MLRIRDTNEDWASIEANIVRLATDYIHGSCRESLVIGLSGGVDSTLTAALARKVCDSLGIRLIGLSLPSDFNKKSEIFNARLAGEAFCDEFFEYKIQKPTQILTNMLTEDKYTAIEKGEINEDALRELKERRGNVMARLRMIFLYDAAKENSGMVLSTDNLTELFQGFWTLHGDVGDFGMIQQLWKTEVYALSSYMFTEELAAGNSERAEALFQAIHAVPTDGLGITDSDLDQLGADSYEQVDRLLYAFLEEDDVKMDHPVILRHLKSAFKRQNPYNLRREDILS